MTGGPRRPLQRARKDFLATLLARAAAAGVRFRWAGVDLLVDGLGRLPLADQAALARHFGRDQRAAGCARRRRGRIAAARRRDGGAHRRRSAGARGGRALPAAGRARHRDRGPTALAPGLDHQTGQAGKRSRSPPTSPVWARAMRARAWCRSTARRARRVRVRPARRAARGAGGPVAAPALDSQRRLRARDARRAGRGAARRD